MDKLLFVHNIKRVCKIRGIKPTVACRESGVGTSFVNNIEVRGQVPSVEKVQKLATYLGVTTSELLGEKIGPAAVTEIRLSARQRELINLFDAASPDLQSAAFAVLGSAEGQVKRLGNDLTTVQVNGLETKQVRDHITRQGYVKKVKLRGRGRGGPARGR